MATRKSPRLNGPPTKRRKVDEVEESPPPIEEQTAPIFNLIDDCCYAILDWLRYEDLSSFGKTCKWAQKLASDFYKMNHSARVCSVKEDAFDLENAQKIYIDTSKLTPYRYVNLYCADNIKQIHLEGIQISPLKVDYLEKVLRTVEHVVLRYCRIVGDFYENFLKFCTNIKVLRIYSHRYRSNGPFLGADNGWLARKYPTLESLTVLDPYAQQINELATFLEQNPNIRSFTTTANCLEGNWDQFRTANIKLDVLAIRFGEENVTGLCERFNFLRECGVFQRLHCLFETNDANISATFGDLASLSGLEKLTLSYSRYSPTTTQVVPTQHNIKELSMHKRFGEPTFETIARSMVDLERVHLLASPSESIVPFIRYAAKLKKMRIESGLIPVSAIDLAAWNKERKKLAGARKVTIYVPEHKYEAIKWTTGKTDYTLIELKRNSSYDWDSEFFLRW